MLSEECLEWISEWIYHNEKLREVNKILFENTQFWEQKYMTDYRDDLFRFFAGKITRFSSDYNKIYKMLTNEERIKLNKIKMKRR